MEVEVKTISIASGQTTSAAIELDYQHPMGLILPSALTSTALTFQMSDTLSGTYVTVMAVDGATTYSVTVGASKYVPLDPRVFAGVNFVKLVCGSSEGADRSIKLIYRPV